MQGVALALGAPVFGVGTLDAMAWGLANEGFEGRATMLVDAGKGNAYYADFEIIGSVPQKASPDGLAGLAELTADGERKIFCDKEDLATGFAPYSGRFKELKYSAAVGAGFCADNGMKTGRKGEVALLTPNYVQKSFAEKSLTQFQEG
jgi:tRNA A37 threonylcarbamoyladenosine modification protein TsaB